MATKTYTTNTGTMPHGERQAASAVRTTPSYDTLGGRIAADGAVASTVQRFQQLADDSPRSKQLKSWSDMAAVSPPVAALQGYQHLANGSRRAVQLMQKPNDTGLPGQLKAGIESLSGISMDHVKVHYQSAKPAQLQAHAYAQGSDIHIAPGQERHLPHEAWHVVQQAQGRVRPTVQAAGGAAVNDDAGLEHEADRMGARALALGGADAGVPAALAQQGAGQTAPVAQLTTAELNTTQALWASHAAKHAVVDGHVQADIAALQGAYNHYALPLNGGHNDVAADAANPFLRNSVLGLMHDIEEIDSHAGGYYYQQEVKAGLNAARNIVNEQGARGGLSNITDPDLIVAQGAGGVRHAVEVKRTTTANGLDGMLDSAISQLSKRRGYSAAAVAVEVTNATQVATVTGNRAAVDNTVSNLIAAKSGFARLYFPQATPHPAAALGMGPYVTLTVSIQDGGAGALIYDRDFWVTLEQRVGRGGRTSYAIQTCTLNTTRV